MTTARPTPKVRVVDVDETKITLEPSPTSARVLLTASDERGRAVTLRLHPYHARTLSDQLLTSATRAVSPGASGT